MGQSYNINWALSATLNALCAPDIAYVYASKFFGHNRIFHTKRCQLGPGRCETPDTAKYYVDADQSWSEIKSQERANALSLYSGGYLSACLGVEADKKCNPRLYWIMKVLTAFGVDLCIMPLFRYYWVTSQLLGGGDLIQLFVLYVRGEIRYMMKEDFQFTDTHFEHPDLAEKCSCMDTSLNGTVVLDADSSVACSDACKLTGHKVKAYMGLNMFIQIGFFVISAVDMHLAARDSPSGEVAIDVLSKSPDSETCFVPDPNIQCS